MAIDKKSNEYRHNHILKAKTYMDDGQSEKRCIPDQQTATRYHKMGLVHNNKHKICHSYHQTRGKTTSSTHDISFKFIFILMKIYLMLGPHQTPFYFA